MLGLLARLRAIGSTAIELPHAHDLPVLLPTDRWGDSLFRSNRRCQHAT